MFSTSQFASSPFDAVSKLVILAVVMLTISAVELSSRCQAQPAAVAVVPLTTHPLRAEFSACDANADGSLTEAEYLKRVGREKPVLLREFKMFDLDGDHRISLAEFVTIPIGQAAELRGTLADPVVVLAETKLARLTKDWKGWDRNGDESLDTEEFKTAAIPSLVPGLESTGFPDWDVNRDQQVSLQEVARVLDIAYGIRIPSGELVRDHTGRVVDLRAFQGMHPDANGKVKRAVYIKNMGGSAEVAEKWFPTINKPGNELFGFAEFATSSHRTDPIGQFLSMDVDLDGRLSRKELQALPAGWGPEGIFWLDGFDDDRDGVYSLREFLFIPQVNLLTTWHGAVDEDEDGKLQPEEFRFHPGVPLAALSAEYFRRLDVNHDQSLSLDEYPFSTTYRPPNEIHVQFADGKAVKIAIPDYPEIYSPEISPDGKWVAVDGWKRGQSNVAAHLLIASVETDEVRDLGIGCIPQWSADGKKIAYSRYGRGVFIRNFEGDANDESIDPHGWAIEFSPDGKQTAYVTGGDNFVIHDIATNARRPVFAEGQSPYNYIEHNFTWSPDSKRICFKGHRLNGAVDVGIVHVTGGDPKLRVLCDATDVNSDFSWLSDGKRLMFARRLAGASRNQIFEMDAEGGKPSVRYPKQPEDRNNIGVSWSRDGKTVVYLSIK
ncbi:MAG: translocation protein TolB [Planctomycetaceae bacterium]|nr:translocation protein TolB [Planctomycetaceae bacterium]